MSESTTTPDPRRLLNYEEVAQILGICERTLWAKKASGEIPHVKFGRCVRFSPDAIERWIADRQKGGEGA